MSREKELAYRYDLFITSDWTERFDKLVDESVEFPTEGRVLDVNCGTGTHALAIAERSKEKGEVIAIDPDPERIALASAKAQVSKVTGVTFQTRETSSLPFAANEFDTVIGDASITPTNEIEPLLNEMVRVTRPGGTVILKVATHGSFDEFFSIYWEVLHEHGIDEEVWDALRALIEERNTVSQTEEMAERAGLHDVEVVSKKEEFLYDAGKDFMNSPLIEDYFMSSWLEIVRAQDRENIRARIESVIDRERGNAPFDVSIKATVVAGVK